MLVRLIDFYETQEVFPEKAYPRVEEETLVFFLKRFNFLIEITPLHSRARSLHGKEAKISKVALKKWLIPTELIR